MHQRCWIPPPPPRKERQLTRVCSDCATFSDTLNALSPSQVKHVLRGLQYESHAALDRHAIASGLQRMGYALEASEVDKLMSEITLQGDEDAPVPRSAFVASQASVCMIYCDCCFERFFKVGMRGRKARHRRCRAARSWRLRRVAGD